jgi:hypothetical protein
MTTIAIFALHASASPLVLALQDAVVNPPAAPSRAMGLNGAVWGFALMALLGGAIVGVSLLPSKRGHQD